MMLEEAAHIAWPTPWAMGLAATLGALLSVAYSFRFLAQGFLGPQRADYPHKPHDPGPGLWAAPAARMLAALVILIGLFPNQIVRWIVNPAASATIGRGIGMNVTHWHGLAAPARGCRSRPSAAASSCSAPGPASARSGTPAPNPRRSASSTPWSSRWPPTPRKLTATSTTAASAAAWPWASQPILAAGAWAFLSAPYLPGGRGVPSTSGTCKRWEPSRSPPPLATPSSTHNRHGWR